jgi:hypothetical protein
MSYIAIPDHTSSLHLESVQQVLVIITIYKITNYFHTENLI